MGVNDHNSHWSIWCHVKVIINLKQHALVSLCSVATIHTVGTQNSIPFILIVSLDPEGLID